MINFFGSACFLLKFEELTNLLKMTFPGGISWVAATPKMDFFAKIVKVFQLFQG